MYSKIRKGKANEKFHQKVVEIQGEAAPSARGLRACLDGFFWAVLAE